MGGPSVRTPLLIAGGGLLIGLAMGAAILFGLPAELNRPPVQSGGGTPQVLGAAPVTGAPAPEFSLESLAGEQVSLADARGHPVLINFWATWCGPCRVEMPAIQSRYEMHKDQGLRVYAIDFDEPRELVEDFAKAFGLTFDVLLDPGGQVNNTYKIIGYPTSFFVAADGVIQIVHVGAMTEGQLDEYLVKILP